MADLFTHVLAGFIIATILSWRVDWITPSMIAVAMLGATLPDLNRLDFVISSTTIDGITGLDWSWVAFHRVGGTFIVIAIITLMVPRRYMKAVAAMLVLGAASHYTLDLLLYKPSGQSGALFWPITDYRVAIDGFYLSSDRWPAVLAMLMTGVVLIVERLIIEDQP